MRPYEVVVIFDAGRNDGEIRKGIDRISAQLKAGKAEVTKVDSWGRRRFAYEIDHKSEGFYVLFELKATPALIADLDRDLGLADDVVRHKVIRIPEHVFGNQSPIRVTIVEDEKPRRRESSRSGA